MNKTFKILMVLIFAYLLLLTWLFVLKPPAIVPAAAAIPDPEVKQGNYTIFHYTNAGWTNKLYITDYYIKDGILYYKLRESQGGFLPVEFEDCLIVPDWIETIDELMNYGFWEPGDDSYEPGS
ncbi:MAG: hypothetical protein ACM3TR_11610 [Caulobacteraceae bacterium]